MSVLTFRSYRATCHFGMLERSLASSGFRFRQVMANDDAPTLHSLVAAGIGDAIIPRLAVNRTDERVRILPLDTRIPSRRICLAWDAGRPPAGKVRLLVDSFVRASARFG